MAEHLYEAAWTYTSGAAAHAIGEVIPATLAAGVRPPQIREIGIYSQSGVAAEVGIGLPAAIGITPASEVTVQATSGMDTVAGNTVVATSWGTAPTAPATFTRRSEPLSVTGGLVVFMWNLDELELWPGAAIPTLVIWQISALAATYDCYVKVAE